jgi:hypothetical protein
MRLTTSVAVTDDRTLCTIAASGEIELKDGACGTSSLRYKENIQGIGYGLAEVNKLNPVFFNYLKDSSATSSLSMMGDRTKRKVGFIAEEMNQIIPEVVIWQDGQVDGIDYAFLTSVLTKALQELNQKVDGLGSTTSLTSDTLTLKKIASNLGNWTIDEDGTMIAKRVITEEMIAKKLAVSEAAVFGSMDNPIGITLYDKITKEPYCAEIVSGEWVKTKGVCGAAAPPSPGDIAPSTPSAESAASVIPAATDATATSTISSDSSEPVLSPESPAQETATTTASAPAESSTATTSEVIL